MKVLEDGFKVIEKDDKIIPDCLYAMNDNIILLHEQIKQLREDVSKAGKRVLYRPVRETLAESMAESRAFDTVDEMKEFIAKQVREWPGCSDFSASDIYLGRDIGDDERIGWKNERYIMFRTRVDPEPGVCGTCGE